MLWLVSGGSAIGVAVQTADILNGSDLSKLSIGLADERYGVAGHPDSNWRRLLDSGFRIEGARLYPVLRGRPVEESANEYRIFIDRHFDSADYKIALLGVGTDCHTAGVLPGSPAVDAEETVIAYQGSDFVRITLTLNGLLRFDEVFVYAIGESKRQPLEILAHNKEVPLGQCPIRVIRRIPEWSVYNDLLGEAI